MTVNLNEIDFKSSMLLNDDIHAAFFLFPEELKPFSETARPLVSNKIKEDTRSILIKKKSTFHRFR